MATLTTMLARVRAVLVDGSSLLWTDGTATEGLRLALGEYGLASETPAQLEGLDGVLATNLPGAHESLVVWGAAGYAALARAVDRADNAQLGTEASALKEWGDARLKEFKVMLGAAFPGYLTAAMAEAAGVDPAKMAAEVALLGAQQALLEAEAALRTSEVGLRQAESALATEQAALATAQAAAATGKEGRDQAAAVQAAAERAAEAARLAELRAAGGSPWGNWGDRRDISYPDDYERS